VPVWVKPRARCRAVLGWLVASMPAIMADNVLNYAHI